ncbi:PREDICTED: uncharacterized protein LOC108569301 [Nicrophorus vespilloides]|uniref:Uncharacterized protein LOC108569301 n=1 Tax=Nicrophorus vespilloides TaxID=110193 RepID=A0ABM1NHJ6_NICVS|nr:PREDICTED: uncharacterized protein LOC108569301 [Nicrophorus vespilloides]XP_017786297.1 PREDICTED: uncharacterized protein LOC108569301 [Nicrophorus vespilloides]
MGSCVGRCLPRADNPFTSRCNSLDFTFLIEDNSSYQEKDSSKRGFLARLFAKRKSRKKPKKPVLEFVDEMLNPHVTCYSRLSESQRLPSTSSYNSRDIPLQCLDAKALLAHTTASTPLSSLDLEWEHETLPISSAQDASAGSSWTAIPDDTISQSESITNNAAIAANNNSDSDWSRVSSANSLEWDSVQHSYHPSPPASEIDTDTQLLLTEIERLTNQTLQETGKELFS